MMYVCVYDDALDESSKRKKEEAYQRFLGLRGSIQNTISNLVSNYPCMHVYNCRWMVMMIVPSSYVHVSIDLYS